MITRLEIVKLSIQLEIVILLNRCIAPHQIVAFIELNSWWRMHDECFPHPDGFKAYLGKNQKTGLFDLAGQYMKPMQTVLFYQEWR